MYFGVWKWTSEEAKSDRDKTSVLLSHSTNPHFLGGRCCFTGEAHSFISEECLTYKTVFRVRCSFIGEALRFYGAAHLCLCDSELSAREHLDDKTVQLTYRKHIFLGRAAVLQVRRTVLSARCSVFRVRCSFTGEVLHF